ncbi:unnamed protein product [Arctia plantaginis]|uniref:Uncharacterized protein n=1 Tax=Arctia plantaginis TaxID=874455 RepID=A0A8S1AZQ5_ARCPL|nr:unnamed protein product [Arctia plantaginis]CAB3250523.1 unnamed protein product [Arctia plantaginis]
METEGLLLLKKIPQSGSCHFCINVQCGRNLMTILGILCAFTCSAIILIKDRKHITTTTIILIIFLSLFVAITMLFVFTSVLLLLAALDENPDLMSNYIWHSIIYLCLQLLLSIAIPLILIAEGRYSVTIALVWMVIVMIIGLGWTHFISVVSTFKNSLLS